MTRENLLPLAILCVAFASEGCGSETSVDELGSARVIALTAENVERMELTVSAPDFSDIVVDLPRVGMTNEWRDDVSVPVGTNRTFTARAFDSSDTLIYEGSATDDVEEGMMNGVVINLQDVNPPDPFENVVPIFIAGITISNVAPVTGEDVVFAATAVDSDPLTFLWSVQPNAGTLLGENTAQLTWTTPNTPNTDYTISIAVSDPTGATATLDVTLRVFEAPPVRELVDVQAFINTAPVVTNIVPSLTRIAVGEATNLTPTFSDSEDDVASLTFEWASAAECDGTFDDDAGESPSFTLNAVPSGLSQSIRTCTLGLRVTDTGGLFTEALLTIAASCTLLTQDCPDGQACYPTESTGANNVCADPGSGAIGTSCAASVQCATGLTCIDGLCQEICDPSTPVCSDPAFPNCNTPIPLEFGVCTP